MSISRLYNWLASRHQGRLRKAAAIVSPPSATRARRGRLVSLFALWVVVVLLAGFFDASDSWGLGFGFGWFEGYAYRSASAARAAFKRDPRALKHAAGDLGQSGPSDVVIVTLSDATFSSSSFAPLPGPPVPRDYHAKVIRALSQAGAKIIAFDLIFDAPRPQDKALADAVVAAQKRGTQVIWGSFVDESNQLVMPNPQLQKASSNIGHLLIEQSPTRPLFERIPAFIIGEPDKIPALSLKIAMLAKGIKNQSPHRVPGGWQMEDFFLPIEEDGTFAISYTSTRENAFPYVPFENVLSPGADVQLQNRLFKNKIVLIGDSTKIGNDFKDTPLGIMPGVEIHAHAINTLLKGQFLHIASVWTNLFLIGLLPALLAFFHDTRRVRNLILSIFLGAVGYLLLALWLFVSLDYSIHMVGPLVALSLFSTGVLIQRGLREERERQRMFDALVLAASSAIESRDPSTAGHSRRVTCLTLELAIAVSASRIGKFRRVRYSALQIKELCYAALLHDFGKIGVREAVLTKSHKLEPLHFQVVKSRFLFLKSARQEEFLEQKIALLQSNLSSEELQSLIAERETAHNAARQELDEDLNRLERANDPQVTWMSDEEYVKLRNMLDEMESRSYCDENGVSHPLISSAEKDALAIRKGSLTQDEFKQIQNHAQMSYDFLKQIHWTRDLENLAHIAWGHHEKLSGKGYPRGVKAEDLPLTTRMMTIADIFDALTSSDRPYKKALPLERALSILQEEAKDEGIDSDLLEVFIEHRVYEAIEDDRSAWLFPNRTRAAEKS